MKPTGRLHEVDALRGLAALTVVASHFAGIFPFALADTRARGATIENLFKYTPLHALWSGSQAVMLFFVISGFVLALPFFGRNPPRYVPFVLRRITRLWPTYAAACVLGFLLAGSVAHGSLKGLTAWVNARWQHPLSAHLFAQHLALVDQFNANAVDPVLWTLVHEMRVSLVFPLLVVAVARFRPSFAIGGILLWTVVTFHAVPASANDANYYYTAIYVGFFASGVLIARYHTVLTSWIARRGQLAAAGFAAATLALYTYSAWMPIQLQSATLGFVLLLVSTSAMLLLALGWHPARRLLLTRPLQFFGRISYSLYLVHALVILALLHLLYGRVSLLLLIPLMCVVSVILAQAGERYIERPSIQLGRMLTTRWQVKRPIIELEIS